jgi:hypothetical protein
MANVRRLRLLDFENREELMFAELEERIALAFIELFEIENVFVKRNRLFDVVDFDRDMIAPVNLNASPARTAHFRIYIAAGNWTT